ncbi:flagellar hook-associated protein FlgL [Diaminobutyricimonas sp. LJ205]|uniref:flagellar hook-associated protein FlgL n=1 Tax=Diaminobutyricimonas sp. LJ205 TaxID=2683590 RepID=UPI0012F4E927|nr:flagellar hook-associated protein FlgL [Diaminobutyricimonas sp. LJ205]
MITRTTTSLMMQSAQRNLKSNMQELARLQEQATSQKAITRPSDDPTATADSLRIRAEQRASEQYGRNIDDGLGWLTVIDSTLATTTGLMNRVRDLTVQGANDGSMSPTAKQAIVTELTQLRDELLTQANTQYLGRTVFAGNSDTGAAFDSTPPYGYTVAGGGTVDRRIGAGSTIRVDADGVAAFASGPANPAGNTTVFALIDDIVADLNGGVNIGTRIGAVDQHMIAIREQQAIVGTRHAQILRAEEAHMENTVSLEGQRAAVEDIDLAEVILDLQLQEVAYQSALAVTARVLQPTLMDFLR